MTLNEVNIIKNSVLDATEAYVDARLSVADFAKTQIGVTEGTPTPVHGKFYHTVVCNATSNTAGVTYHNVLSVGNTPFPDGSVVFLIAPNAQFSNQFILGKLDDTPVHITGGTINIGDGNFVVDEDGDVTIKKGGIYLNKTTGNNYNLVLNDEGIKLGYNSRGYRFTVNATDGSVTIRNGQINLGEVVQSGTVVGYDININSNGINVGYVSANNYNFTVTDKGKVTIKDGSINLTYNSTLQDYNFKADSNGIKLGLKGTTPANKYYNFSVDNNGKFTMKSGSITLSDKFKVDETGWLAIGGTTSSANFYVATDGSLTMKSGSITLKSKFKVDTDGNLSIGGTTSSAPFYVEAATGSLTMKKGSITLSNKLKIDDSGWLAIGGTTSSANFYVDNQGNVTAKYITANNGGQIAGFTISSSSLKKGDAVVSQYHMGCGQAGKGIINLVGNNDRPYIALTDSGTSTTFTDGTVIYGIMTSGSSTYRGVVRTYDEDGDMIVERFLSNIPEKEIYADAAGYLHWR